VALAARGEAGELLWPLLSDADLVALNGSRGGTGKRMARFSVREAKESATAAVSDAAATATATATAAASQYYRFCCVDEANREQWVAEMRAAMGQTTSSAPLAVSGNMRSRGSGALMSSAASLDVAPISFGKPMKMNVL
jgi:hypothetical protein